MTSFPPTPEQQSIIDFAANDDRNLIINAYAGAAKTTTLVMIANELNKIPILVLAFNKRIAVEMQSKLSSMCNASTLNAIGHRTWNSTIGKNLYVSGGKNYKIVKEIVDVLPDKQQKEAYEFFAEMIKTVAFGKSCGYIPDDFILLQKLEDKTLPQIILMNDEEFYDHLEYTPSDLAWEIITRASCISLHQALDGKIDFDDQILLPTCFNASFPQYPLVMVDEAQDLSSLNHQMLKKIAKRRLIAVGDKCQAIYGFRGAHENSMEKMRQEFEMHSLNLNVSFRCPVNIIESVKNHAPNMVAWEQAKPGSVEHLGQWDSSHLNENTVIICRNNAPLFRMAIALLKDGVAPELYGNDITKMLLKILTSFGSKDLPQEDCFRAVNGWEEKALKRSRSKSKARIYDQAECLRIFVREGINLGAAIEYLNHIMTANGMVKLMTGHKAKGLEFDTVYYLDQFLLDLDKSQEKNLNYVIKTRAQNKLYFVQSENFFSQDRLGETDD